MWGGDAHDDHRQRAGGHNEVPISSQASHVVLQGDTASLAQPWGNPKIRQCGEPHQSSPVPRRGATCWPPQAGVGRSVASPTMRFRPLLTLAAVSTLVTFAAAPRPTPTGSGSPASAPAPPTGSVSTPRTPRRSRCTPRPRTTACSGRPTTASTWSAFNTGLEGIPGAKNVRTVFTSGTTVYAGTTAGLFKSTGGGGFQPVAQGPEEDPKNPKKLNAPVQAVFTGILPGSPMLAARRQRRRLQVHRRRRDVAAAGPGQRDGGRGDRLEPRLVQGQRRADLRGDAERHLHLDRLRLQLDAVQRRHHRHRRCAPGPTTSTRTSTTRAPPTASSARSTSA